MMTNRIVRIVAVLLLIVTLLFGLSFQNEKTNNSQVKFNPGHYVAVGPSFDLSELKYLNEPAVRGLNKRYYWRKLEQKKGEYDLSSIERDLDFCATNDKQLIVFLM